MGTEAIVLGGVLKRENSRGDTSFIHLDTGVKMTMEGNAKRDMIVLYRDKISVEDILCAKDICIACSWIKVLTSKYKKEQEKSSDLYLDAERVKECVGINYISQAIHQHFNPRCKKISYCFERENEVEEHTIQFISK